MQFLAQNWFYILALILFVAMHVAGFGCGHRHETDSGHPDRDRLKRSRSEHSLLGLESKETAPADVMGSEVGVNVKHYSDSRHTRL